MKSALLINALVFLMMIGCQNSSEGSDAGHFGTGTCGEIARACHNLDTGGTGPLAECHTVGHNGDQTVCEMRRTECLALCAQDGGTSADSGPETLCEELGHICHAYDNGSGVGHDCHEVGHDGDEAACMAAEVMCRAACMGDAGPRPDSGVPAHDEDAGPNHHDEDGGAAH